MENFVTVAIFNYPHEIAVLRSRLDLEGIPHYFENETLVDVVPMYSLAVGGIRLKVHHKDAPLVKQILKEIDENPGLYIV